LKIPKPSDEKLVKSMYAKCIAHTFFTATRAEQIQNEFVINHFACVVKYQIQGFVEKNRNDIGQEVYESLEGASSDFVKNLLLQCDDKFVVAKRLRELNSNSSATGDRNSLDWDGSVGGGVRERTNSKAKTQSGKGSSGGGGSLASKKTSSIISHFSSQLNDLISKIRSMRSHFIRCIKPNNTLSARSFEKVMVQTQLRCGGALGAIQVFHAGFPNRMDFKYFVTRYTCFLTVCGRNILTADLLNCIQTAKSTSSDQLWRAATSMLLDIISLTITILFKTESFEIPEGVDVITGLQMGKTQVFLKASVFELLERLQFQSQIFIAKILQRRRRAAVLSRAYHAAPGGGGGGGKGKSLSCQYHAMRSYLHIVSKRRSQARNCISATILLQRKVRVFLAVSWRKRILRAITRLKARYRGGIARKMIFEMKLRAALRIQTLYRQHSCRGRYRFMRAQAAVLQKYLRRYLAVIGKIRKLRGIVKLQCLWRGTMARIRTVAYRQKLVSALLFFCYGLTSLTLRLTETSRAGGSKKSCRSQGRFHGPPPSASSPPDLSVRRILTTN
jgi:myosin V